MSNPPRNHHFIPQYFLKAWQHAEGRIFRYRRLPFSGAMEIKSVAIKRTASIKDLYYINFPDGGFEVESSHVTPLIDEAGHKVIERARGSSVQKWDTADRRQLANTLTSLEARHPDILKAMDVRSALEPLRQKIKAEHQLSHKSVDELIDYFKASRSLGVLSLILFAQNELLSLIAQPFSDGLLRASMREYSYEHSCLLCSDYPTSRWGDYLKDLLFIIAISPSKALVFSNNPSIVAFDRLKPHALAQLINLYTLGKAQSAYYSDDAQGEFVFTHLGWALNRPDVLDQRQYVEDFLRAEDAWSR
jgi:Protein of unknown function (DUF4238)